MSKDREAASELSGRELLSAGIEFMLAGERRDAVKLFLLARGCFARANRHSDAQLAQAWLSGAIRSIRRDLPETTSTRIPPPDRKEVFVSRDSA